jgi:hypothetical protein
MAGEFFSGSPPVESTCALHGAARGRRAAGPRAAIGQAMICCAGASRIGQRLHRGIDVIISNADLDYKLPRQLIVDGSRFDFARERKI